MEITNKTQEQIRGGVLEKRLKTLNDFLFKYSGSDKLFGEYLKEIGIDEARFLSKLPEDLLFPGISNENSDSKRLVEYGRALNLVYHLQHLKHANNTDDFSSFEIQGAPQYNSDGVITYDNYGEDFLNGFGSWLKKTIDNVKKETQKVVEKVKKKVKKTGAGIKKTVKDPHIFRKMLHGINKFNPVTAVPRNAFLSLLNINATALANAFNHIENDKDKTEWNKILKTWDALGGEKSALTKVIDNGSKKKPFPKIKKRHSAAGGDESIDVTNPANAGKVAAGSAAGLTGLAGILATNPVTAPSAVYVASGAAVLGAVSPILKKYASRKGESVSGIESPAIPGLDPDTMAAIKAIQDGTDDGDATSDIMGFLNQNKWWFIGGFTFLVGGLLMLSGGDKKS